MTDHRARYGPHNPDDTYVAVEYRSFPDVGHALHHENPQLYVDTVLAWVKTLEL